MAQEDSVSSQEHAESAASATAAPTEPPATEPPATEPPIADEPEIAAGHQEAYVAVAAENWNVQYMGKRDGGDHLLKYNAGIARVGQTGASYKVSVTADSNGFRRNMTGDPHQACTVRGLDYLAVVVNDPDFDWLDYEIDVFSVRVDGREIRISGSPSTEYDGDGLVAVLYHPSQEYAQLVSPEDFREWTTVEIEFAVIDPYGQW